MFYFSVVIRCHPRFYRTLQLSIYSQLPITQTFNNETLFHLVHLFIFFHLSKFAKGTYYGYAECGNLAHGKMNNLDSNCWMPCFANTSITFIINLATNHSLCLGLKGLL